MTLVDAVANAQSAPGGDVIALGQNVGVTRARMAHELLNIRK